MMTPEEKAARLVKLKAYIQPREKCIVCGHPYASHDCGRSCLERSADPAEARLGMDCQCEKFNRAEDP